MKLMIAAYILSAVALIGIVATIIITDTNKNIIKLETGEKRVFNIRFPLSVMADGEFCGRETDVKCQFEWKNDGHADISVWSDKKGTYKLTFLTEKDIDAESYTLVVY